MDFKKMLLSGLKTVIYVIVGLVIGALTVAMGFKPEGLMNEAIWTYAVLPALAGIVAMLKNYIQHKDD